MTVAGFGLFVSVVLVLLVSPVFSPLADNPFSGFLLRFLFLVCFAALLPLTRGAYAERLARAPLSIGCNALLCLLTALAAALPSLCTSAPFGLMCALWGLMGACAGQALVVWGTAWSGVDADRAKNSFCSICVGCSVCVAVVACSFMLFAPITLSGAVCVALLAVSAYLQHAATKRLGVDAGTVRVGESRERFLLKGASMLTPFSAAFALGVALALNGLVFGVQSGFPFALGAVCTGALVAIVASRALGCTPENRSVERVVFPLYGACLVVLPLVPAGAAVRVVLLVLMASLFSFLIFHWNTLVLLSYRKRLLPAFHFGQGLIATTCGIAAGWGVVALFTVALGVDPSGYFVDGWADGLVPGLVAGSLESVATYACAVSVLVLVVVQAIVPYGENKTDKAALPAGSDACGEDAPARGEEGRLKDAIEEISAQGGLTPREREVFGLLARGRTASSIAERLVISVHTAKTHTYRIYRKLDVSSQQQLLDMVEAEADSRKA